MHFAGIDTLRHSTYDDSGAEQTPFYVMELDQNC